LCVVNRKVMLFCAQPYFVILDMEKTEEAIFVSPREADKHDGAIVEEKPTSKRQLKLQKRREAQLERKAAKKY